MSFDDIDWITLSRFRNSFLSKATTILALSSLILSNSPKIVGWLELESWEIMVTFLGSMVFLIGYLLYSWKVPNEFRLGGEVHDIVQRMKLTEDQELLKTRRDKAKKLEQRVSSYKFLKFKEGATASLISINNEIAGEDPIPVEKSISLYRADLQVRRLENPSARLVVFTIMLIGVILLFIPTLLNIVVVISKFFR